ncbi:MAG: toll/interleukin-1 receptor domain-containing protein [Gemmataceae bacterium]|nr:toll/interleukin-1 receptor domain-containing protein [Gemmataceae bacterium]
MTAISKRTCDVFISHAVSDRALASKIAETLEAAGLATFHADAVEPGQDWMKSIWNALAESRAVIVLVSPETPASAWAMVEIGAAAAWNKPVFVLLNGPSSGTLPPPLNTYPVYPLNRLEEVILSIRKAFEPLSERERGLLTEVYQYVGIPADQLSQSPKSLRDLTTRFNRRARKQLSGERLLSEILRLRKRNQLPRLRSRKSISA